MPWTPSPCRNSLFNSGGTCGLFDPQGLQRFFLGGESGNLCHNCILRLLASSSQSFQCLVSSTSSSTSSKPCSGPPMSTSATIDTHPHNRQIDPKKGSFKWGYLLQSGPNTLVIEVHNGTIHKVTNNQGQLLPTTCETLAHYVFFAKTVSRFLNLGSKP